VKREPTPLEQFAIEERQRYPGQGNNRFAFAFAQVSRYDRFIRIIHQRHQAAAERFSRNTRECRVIMDATGPGTHEVGPQLAALFDEASELTLELHLEIETFYLFAKILLDKVARFVENNFGAVRSLALDSHDDFTKRLNKYMTAKDLSVPKELPTLSRELKQRIADFRDYQIAHEKSPRTLHYTAWGGENKPPRLALTRIYPLPGEEQQSESGNLDEILFLLDSYMRCLIELVATNRQKSIYAEPSANGAP